MVKWEGKGNEQALPGSMLMINQTLSSKVCLMRYILYISAYVTKRKGTVLAEKTVLHWNKCFCLQAAGNMPTINSQSYAFVDILTILSLFTDW